MMPQIKWKPENIKSIVYFTETKLIEVINGYQSD